MPPLPLAPPLHRPGPLLPPFSVLLPRVGLPPERNLEQSQPLKGGDFLQGFEEGTGGERVKVFEGQAVELRSRSEVDGRFEESGREGGEAGELEMREMRKGGRAGREPGPRRRGACRVTLRELCVVSSGSTPQNGGGSLGSRVPYRGMSLTVNDSRVRANALISPCEIGKNVFALADVAPLFRNVSETSVSREPARSARTSGRVVDAKAVMESSKRRRRLEEFRPADRGERFQSLRGKSASSYVE